MSQKVMETSFLEAVREREAQVTTYLRDPRFRGWFGHPDLSTGVYSYLERPSKRLRPVVLLLACGAVGADEAIALPAAAGVELFHTWTLVHDDLIDNDSQRRGGPTVHEYFAEQAARHDGRDPGWAAKFGRDMSILAGDSQHAWSIWSFLETGVLRPDLAPVALAVVQHLESVVINRLIEGQILDVQFTQRDLKALDRGDILEMLYLKTGALYEFAAVAGASIGLGRLDWDHPWIAAMGHFAKRCGTAFQLQDDILGIVGSGDRLGKPIGSDIREGKRTTIAYYAYQDADAAQRRRLDSLLGKRDADQEEFAEAVDLLVALGGIQRTADLARHMTQEALSYLGELPDSPCRRSLFDWAEFLVQREF